MKKIFCAVLALAAMASCSKEYIVAEDKQAIGFGEAFVDNGTRADYSTDKVIEAFKVYGTLTGNYGTTVQIFKGAEVERPTTIPPTGYDNTKAWLCDETQYWVPNANYNFIAVVDGELNKDVYGNYLNTISFTVADGTLNKDLLLATASAETNGDGTVKDGTNASGLVAFTFDHLLSKLQFTITSNIGAGYSIDVTGITVTGVAKDGIYTVAGDGDDDGDDDGAWAQVGDATTELTFGRQGAYETRQILPVEQELEVTIAYDIYFGEVETGT